MRVQYRHRERGATLVEFALITPVIALILVGIFDLGRGIYYYNTLSHLAREGARRAAVLNHADGLQQPQNNAAWHFVGNEPKTYKGTDAVDPGTVVDEIVNKAVSLDRSQLSITIDAVSRNPWQQLPVTVAVEYPYKPASIFIFQILGKDTLTLRASSTMTIE